MSHRHRLPLAFAALLALATAGAGTATALTLDLDRAGQADFGNGLLDNGDTATSGPLTVTFSDVVTSDGLPGAQVDQDGIFFSRDPFDYGVVSMTMTFNLPTILTAYDVDWFFPGSAPSDTASFQILGPGGTATAAMTLFPDASAPARIPFDMGSIPVFRPGVSYLFTHTVTGTDASQIDEFDFSIVPLPAGGLLLASGLLGLGLVERRRRPDQSQRRVFCS